jgi:DNA-binding transcriptional MocR family regulator
MHLRKPAPVPKIRTLPVALRGLPHASPPRPFRPYEPALAEFPMDVWARIAGRSLRRAPTSLLVEADPRGYAPLREAIAAYLGYSRGVNCSHDQIVVASGVQQGLGLVARALVKPGRSADHLDYRQCNRSRSGYRGSGVRRSIGPGSNNVDTLRIFGHHVDTK